MKNGIKAMPALIIDSATLTGGYDPFDAAGLTQACSIIRIVNDSNTNIGVSYDGVDTHEVINSGDSIQLTFQSNSRPNNKVALMAKGSNICAIGAAGVGNIYLIGYYQD